MRSYSFSSRFALYGLSLLALALVLVAYEWRALAAQAGVVLAGSAGSGGVHQAFEEAAQEFQVPAPLLKAICYMEGRLSNNDGHPSIDNGYGCMHLIQNSHG